MLSPWDTCIDLFNTRPPTFETSLESDISSPALPRTDKYQWEQRTCLSYPLWLGWMQHAPASPNWFFVVICALGCSEARQRGVLFGFVWLWLLVALNTASSQGDWQALHSSPICMNDNLSPSSANHTATAVTERNRMKRPSIKVRQLFQGFPLILLRYMAKAGELHSLCAQPHTFRVLCTKRNYDLTDLSVHRGLNFIPVELGIDSQYL